MGGVNNASLRIGAGEPMKSTVLETSRLQMRPMTPDDVPDLQKVFGDPESMRFYPAPFDRERMQRWVEWTP